MRVKTIRSSVKTLRVKTISFSVKLHGAKIKVYR